MDCVYLNLSPFPALSSRDASVFQVCYNCRYTDGQTPVTQVVRLPLHMWSDSRYKGGKRLSLHRWSESPVTQAFRLPLHRRSDSRYTGGQNPVTQVVRLVKQVFRLLLNMWSKTPDTEVVRLPLHRWSDSRYTGGQRLPLHRWSVSRFRGGQRLP